MNYLAGTLLHLGVEENEIESIFKIINTGINTPDNKGNTRLHLAVQDGNIFIVSVLLNKGADPYLKDLSGSSSMRTAMKNNNVSMMKVLINADGNVNTRNKQESLVDIATFFRKCRYSETTSKFWSKCFRERYG